MGILCVGRQDGFFRMTPLHTSGHLSSSSMEAIEANGLNPEAIDLVIELSDIPQYDGSRIGGARLRAQRRREGKMLESKQPEMERHPNTPQPSLGLPTSPTTATSDARCGGPPGGCLSF